MKINFLTKLLLFVFFASFHTSDIFAESQKLCIRKKLRITNDRIKHGKALLVISDGSCPKGTKELLNTSIFKGADGKNGVDGAAGTNGSPGADTSGGNTSILNLYSNLSTISVNTSNSRITHVHSGSAFQKSSKTSVLKITITGTARITNDATIGAGYNLQIRVNNADSSGNVDDNFNKTISGSYSIREVSLPANSSLSQPFHISAIFTNLNSGNLIPSLWANINDAQQLVINHSTVGQTMIMIEEIEL